MNAKLWVLSKERGAALVELALVMPLLLILTMITTEFGRAMYQYNVITKSVRDAVRYLSVQTPNDSTHFPQTRNLVVYGNTNGSGTPLAPNLAVGNVLPSWGPPVGSAPIINVAKVTVQGYCFRPLFTGVFGVNFNTVACGGTAGIPFGNITATMRALL